MKMHLLKRLTGPFLILAVLVATPGCTDKYFERIDELQARLDALQSACDQINSDLAQLKKLIEAIQAKDMITGITEIQENGVTTGYKINFVQHDPVTIMNGKDGNIPLISSKYDADGGNYYWTVQYGSGTVEWLLDPEGNKVLAVGVLPYLTIRDGNWYYTLDGVTYMELGRADGNPGDPMINSIDTSNSDYVIITLANGQKLKIPTYQAYLGLKERVENVNKNTDATAKIIQAILDKITYLTDVSPILDGTDTVGLSFGLNNGKRGQIYDWTSAVTPVIFAKKDTTDNKLYWAYEFGTLGEQWVLTPDKQKILASSEPAEAPVVGVTRGDDGEWYWTVTYKGTTELLRFPVEGGYAPHALDSAQNCAFSAVVNNTFSLDVTLKDGTKLSLPKQYSVSFFYEEGSRFDGDTLTMKMVSGGDRKRLRYQAFGPNPTFTTVGEGGFDAYGVSIDDVNYIEFHAPALFQNGVGKVMVIFTFGSTSAPTSVVRSFYFKREE